MDSVTFACGWGRSRVHVGPRARLLPFHVRHVRLVVAQEQIRGVAARRVVAVVADVHPIGDRTYRERERQTMRAHGLATVLRVSVALWVSRPLPLPTFVWSTDIDLRPEPELDVPTITRTLGAVPVMPQVAGIASTGL